MSEKKALLIGYSFQDSDVQIGYYSSDMEEPQLLSQTSDPDLVRIPVCLCKLDDSNQWLFGTEARSAYEQGHGELTEDLIRLCLAGEPVLVDHVPYMPSELLGIFLKRSLNLLHRIINLDQIHSITFTFPELPGRLVADMRQAMAQLPVPGERLFLQDHKESFYDFVIHQKRELWTNDVMLLDAREGGLYAWNLGRAKAVRGTPFTVTETALDEFQFGNKDGDTDARFTKLLEQLIQKRLISSVFLVGREFQGNWMQESLRYLCRGRRVFGVENMEVKGACYRGLRGQEKESDRRQFYLGEQQVKYHIGLYVWNGREQQYCRLVWAGTSWFDAGLSQVFLVDDCDSICFQTDAATEVPEEERSFRKTISLDWLPKRPNLATKIRVDLRFESADKWTVTVTDMGLGELFPASGKSVTEQIGG